MNHRNSDVPVDEKNLEIAMLTKGLTAPRITPEHINAQIAGESYHLFAGTCLTVCVLTLANGFTVTGESACASPENFDAQIGRDLARRNARDKIWSLEGYLLKQRLHEQQQTKQPTHICKECGALWKLIDKDVFHGSGPSWNLTSGQCGACCDNAAMGDQIKALHPHELRVIAEADELAEKVEKLQAFGKTEVYAKLPVDEQVRLVNQLGAMELYLEVLKERIAAFGKVEG